MRCTAVYRPGISVAKCVAHDCDIGDVPCLTARIADLEAAIARMHRAVPGGSICDPQRVADDMREIAVEVGVDVDLKT